MAQMDYNLIVAAIASAEMAPLLVGAEPTLTREEAADAVREAVRLFNSVTEHDQWLQLIMSLRPGD